MKVDIDSISKLRVPSNWRNLLLELPNQPGFSKVPIILTGLMILLFTSSLAEFTWLLFSPDSNATSARSLPQIKRSNSRNSTQIRLGDVAKLSLFGKAAAQNSVASTKDLIDAPDTSLRLTLKGLLAVSNAAHAIAIIADDRGK